MNKIKMSPTSGFTIVELLVVIVVIGILATLTVVAYTGISQRAVNSSLQSDLSNASTKLKLYYVDNGAYPTSLPLSNGQYCPIPTDTRYCFKASPGNIYTYTPVGGGSPQTYTLDNTNANTTRYRITNNSAPILVSTATITAISAISGTTEVGQVLTAGALTPGGATVSYQWQSAATSGGTYSNISSATNSTYVLVSGDLGRYIKVVATGIGDYVGGVTSAYSSIVLIAFNPSSYYFRSDGVLGPNTVGSSADQIMYQSDTPGFFTANADIKVEKWDTSWSTISAQGAAAWNNYSNTTNTISYSFPGATSVTNNLKIRVTLRNTLNGYPITSTFTTADLGTKFLQAGTWGIVYHCLYVTNNDYDDCECEDGTDAYIWYGGSSNTRITNFGGP